MGRSRSRRRDRSRSRSRDRSRDRRKEKKNDDKRSDDKSDDELQLKKGCQVQVIGLQKNPEKNGAIGTVVEFNKDKGRWLVEFSNGTSNNFKAENLEVCSKALPTLDDTSIEDIPTAKLYITNIAADVDAKELQDLFGKMGMLAKTAPRDSRGNKVGFEDQWPYAVKVYKPGSRGGDGCVEYVDKLAAKAAIHSFNGYKLKGNKLTVQYAGQGKKFEKTELTPSWIERNAAGLVGGRSRSRSGGRGEGKGGEGKGGKGKGKDK